MHHFIYVAWDVWTESTRLVSWFGWPVLAYVLLPLLAVAVFVRVRIFKAALLLVLLVGAPTVLYWESVASNQMEWRYFSKPTSTMPPSPDRAGQFLALG